ncbi:MAG: hypothetical protein U5J83_10215 [Bryobacterales bacterium]|nr:hypothetical protein [Bryobacterales bacterium]
MLQAAVDIEELEILAGQAMQQFARSGQKVPSPVDGAVAFAVGLHGFRGVAVRIHGDGNDPQFLNIFGLPLDIAHQGAHAGAGAGAVDEKEIGDPNPSLQLIGAKGLAVLIGEREGSHRPLDGKRFFLDIARTG